jgi:putative hydrolase of the HAD superfamily
MKYDAVIFDLYGTLVDNFPGKAFEQTVAEMAACVGAPLHDFKRHWHIETWPLRIVGHFPTTEANIEYICRALEVPVDDALLSRAAAIRLNVSRLHLVPRNDVIETLTAIKAAGYKLGLISDCSLEVPRLWPGLPFASFFDVSIFSCTAKMRKPDPRLFLQACEQLAVTPERCLYIGDGGGRELTGARQVGMDAILIRVPYEEVDELAREEALQWSGPRITAVKDVLAVLDMLLNM